MAVWSFPIGVLLAGSRSRGRGWELCCSAGLLDRSEGVSGYKGFRIVTLGDQLQERSQEATDTGRKMEGSGEVTYSGKSRPSRTEWEREEGSLVFGSRRWSILEHC